MKKLEIGQKVFQVNHRDYNRFDSIEKYTEVEITSVGKKYFYINNQKFDIASLKEVKNYGECDTIFLSKDDIDELNQRKILYDTIKEKLNYKPLYYLQKDWIILREKEDLLQELLVEINSL